MEVTGADGGRPGPEEQRSGRGPGPGARPPHAPAARARRRRKPVPIGDADDGPAVVASLGSMNRTLLMVAGALFFGGLFVTSMYQDEFIRTDTGGRPVEVLVALIDIPIGQPLRDEWVTTRWLPVSYVEDRHLTMDDRREILGFPLAQEVHAGECILRTDLSPLSDNRRTLSASVPPGMRAYTLPTTRTSVHGGLLRPGDRVDLLVSIGEFANPLAGHGVVLLQNLLVLAYGQDVTVERSATGERSTSAVISTNVTLQVSVDEAALIAQARSDSAVLQLILRNPNDAETTTARVPDVRIGDVLEVERRNRFVRRALRNLLAAATATTPGAPATTP